MHMSQLLYCNLLFCLKYLSIEIWPRISREVELNHVCMLVRAARVFALYFEKGSGLGR